MSKWGLVGVTLAIILSIACIALGVLYYQENEKRINFEKDLKEVLERKGDLESELSKKGKTITKLNHSIKDLQLECTLNLEKKEMEIVNINQELKELREERNIFESDFSKLKELKTMLEKRIKQIKIEKDNVETTLNTLKKKNKSLLSKLQNLGKREPQLTLQQIVVEAIPGRQGEIMAIDNEYGYAVVDLGMKKGLTGGAVLGIFRNGENIGQAEILKLYENSSMIKIINRDREILENDIVTCIQ